MPHVDWALDTVAAPAVVAIVAAIPLVLGWRGRRVDDHPLCRRCGFDLVGKPTDSAACAECGANLRARRAVRVGTRRTVRGAVAVGLLLLLPSLAVVVYEGVVKVRAAPLAQRKPLWWLLNEASGADAKARDAAFGEIFARSNAGRLSDAQVRSVCERALIIQGDPRKTWMPEWGDFVERAQGAKRVPPEVWARYAAQAPQFRVAAPGSFARRERAWLDLLDEPSRVGNKGEFVLRVRRTLTVTDEDGRRVERDFGWVGYSIGGQSRLGGGWSLPLNEGVLAFLGDGKHRAKLDLVVEVYPAGKMGERAAGAGPLATARRQYEAEWTVLPAGAPQPRTSPDQTAVTRK